MRLILVEWWDTTFQLDVESGKPLRPSLAKTVGYLYEEGDDFVTVAQEVFEDDETFRAHTSIPRRSITRIRDLKEIRGP